MATSRYAGIDVSKNRLDIAVLGQAGMWQMDSSQAGNASLVEVIQETCPELIVVEAPFWAGLAVASVISIMQVMNKQQAGCDTLPSMVFARGHYLTKHTLLKLRVISETFPPSFLVRCALVVGAFLYLRVTIKASDSHF